MDVADVIEVEGGIVAEEVGAVVVTDVCVV